MSNAEIITGTGTVEADTNTAMAMPTFKPTKQAPLFDPKNPYEKAIAKYLEQTASDSLKDKIREAAKAGYDIHTCFSYIRDQAKKQAKDGCAMVEDAVVYGWAVHYFEDEWQSDAKNKAVEKAKSDAQKAKAEADRKAKEEAEAARLANMTDEERELEQLAKDKEAADKALAEEEAKRFKAEEDAKRRAEQEQLRQLEEAAYNAVKNGEEVAQDDMTDAQRAAVKTGMRKAKAEIAEAKKAEREAKIKTKVERDAMQGDLFAGLFN